MLYRRYVPAPLGRLRTASVTLGVPLSKMIDITVTSSAPVRDRMSKTYMIDILGTGVIDGHGLVLV